VATVTEAVIPTANLGFPIFSGLSKKPKASYSYLWCDFVELRCLAHVDHRFSNGDLQELLAEVAAVMQLDDSSEGEEGEEEGDNLNYVGGGVVEGAAGSDSGAAVLPLDDAVATRVNKVFVDLAYRASVFADHYPFELSPDGKELRLREVASAERALYLQLLLASSLRLVPSQRWSELTESFEVASQVIFKCLMPGGWEVHRFGAKGAVRYRGTLLERYRNLADDIREKLKLEDFHFSPQNFGDGGLDLVAWHPMGNDGRVGIPTAFAQCGCTATEWTMKSLQSSPSKLGAVFSYHHPWATYYFMPQDLAESTPKGRDWQRRAELSTAIVVDRLRMIMLASEYGVAEQCVLTDEQIFEAMVFEAMPDSTD
jgi:hypothetical protein